MNDLFDSIMFSPARIVEYLLAGALVFRGTMYWLVPQEFFLAGEVLTSIPVVALIMIMFIIPGALIFYGNLREDCEKKQWGLFIAGLMYMFGVFLNILMVGFIPTSWIYPLILAAIAGALWIRSKADGDELDDLNKVYFRRRWERYRQSRQQSEHLHDEG